VSSLLPPMLPTNLLAATTSLPLIKLDQRSDIVLRPPVPSDTPSPAARRSKIWELSDTLHCSIIGTCLSNAELRHVLVRLNAKGAEAADDHELHVLGVMLASHREAGAKLLQRALDRRHALAIKQYAKAKDDEALRLLWDDSVQRGDIPGAYWALLSHPHSSDAIVKKAFRDVHMLSHLVGAANRADIRRLRQLEEEIGVLNEKLARQQQHLRDGFTSRDQTIRRLNEALIHRAEDGAQSFDANREVETLRTVITEVSRKLGQETARRERLEQRLNATSAGLTKTEAALQMAEADRDAFRRDVELIEDHVIRLLEPATGGEGTLDLSGRTVLYVGGRAHQIPQLKAIAERTGARFLHHDGGIEHGSSLLPGLISRADVLCFPVDCISHDAVATIKRLCRQLEKPYQPLRTASLAAFMSALVVIFQGHETAIAAE
jgi:Uncharacterized protein conserved in bacteria (DUF2325)